MRSQATGLSGVAAAPAQLETEVARKIDGTPDGPSATEQTVRDYQRQVGFEPDGYAGLVLPRSGLAATHGLAGGNAPGLIDAALPSTFSLAGSTERD